MVDPNLISGRMGNRMFQIAYIYSQVREGNIPDIYVQDPKFFKKYEEEIKSMFGENIGFLPYVSIHIRRGDYVENPFYVDLTKTDYYQKALENFPNEKFLVFSDDPEFARSYFPDETTFQIIEGGDEVEDMNMMASCSIGNIIANSSFSFWAAYINPSPTRKVVAPSLKNWFSDGQERTVCPEGWIRI